MTGHGKLLREGRRALLFCLVFFFVLSLGAPAEAAGKQGWKVMHVLDVFGDETEDIYLTNSRPFTGVFNTAEISDAPLEANILVDEHFVNLELWQYGTDRVKFSERAEYRLNIKTEDGTVYYLKGYAYPGDTSLEVSFFLISPDTADAVVDLGGGRQITVEDSEKAAQVFLLLCEKDSRLKIYLEDTDNPAVNYLFTAETGNFGDAYYDALIEPWLASVYERAEQALGAGRYEEAAELFEGLGDYKDSAEQVSKAHTAKNEADYQAALALFDAGDYDAAAAAFTALGDYKDSAERANKLWQDLWGEEFQNAVPGDVVVFGSYEQDNDTANGPEDIEWLVLARENDRLLVISKYALDCQPYNTKSEGVTWESCSLRGWLNDSFLKSAFSSEEQAMIPTVTVSADGNPSYGTDPGKDTKDKVFLLSLKEAANCFSSVEAIKCIPTALAKEKGCYVSDSGVCWWWLRSPGVGPGLAAYVNSGGYVDAFGDVVSLGNCAVRPALWIHLGS